MNRMTWNGVGWGGSEGSSKRLFGNATEAAEGSQVCACKRRVVLRQWFKDTLVHSLINVFTEP